MLKVQKRLLSNMRRALAEKLQRIGECSSEFESDDLAVSLTLRRCLIPEDLDPFQALAGKSVPAAVHQ